MIGAIKRVEEKESLVAAAQQAGLSFEPSPTGRFIRLSGQRGIVYVVQDAWGSGCTVMEMSGGDRRMEHFLSCAPALQAAATEVGLDPARSSPPVERFSFG